MLRRAAVCGDNLIFRSLLAMHRRNIGIAKLRRRFAKRVEHRLQVESRATDDLKHVGSRGLLLQRLPEFVQQPRILDGDDCLRGEVLHQRDLLFGKWTGLLTEDVDRADQLVLLQHWYRNEDARATKPEGRIGCFALRVSKGMNDSLRI